MRTPVPSKNDTYCHTCGSLMRPCQMCGDSFERNGNWTVCSKEKCRLALKKLNSTTASIRRQGFKLPVIIQCVICNYSFVRGAYQTQKITCSETCQKERNKQVYKIYMSKRGNRERKNALKRLKRENRS